MAVLRTILLHYKLDVLFLQETGYVSRAAEEVLARWGYKLLASARPGTLGGVALVVSTAFWQRYGCVVDVVQPGFIMALRSSRQRRFLLVNTYFSSMGSKFRLPQYALLRAYLQGFRSFAIVLGGDQNRVDHARWRWYPPTAGRPSKWGDYNVSESLQFRRQVLLPFGLQKATSDHLGFHHRNGRYHAEIDALFVPASPSMIGTMCFSVVPHTLVGLQVSDHDPLILRVRLRDRRPAGTPAWACQHPRFPEFFAEALNVRSRRFWGHPLIEHRDGQWHRNALPAAFLDREVAWQQQAALAACTEVKRLGRQVLCEATVGCALGLLRRHLQGELARNKISQLLLSSPALAGFFDFRVSLSSGVCSHTLAVDRLQSFVDKQLRFSMRAPGQGGVRKGVVGRLAGLRPRKTHISYYRLRSGEIVSFHDDAERVAEDLSLAWTHVWADRALAPGQERSRSAMLQAVHATVSSASPDWGLQAERLRESWKTRQSCPGPNGQPWDLPRALPFYFSQSVVAQGHFIMRGGSLLGYFEHDLFWIGKKPELVDGRPTYSADSVRDISVGNWQLRALEQELAAPVTQVLDQIIHEANVGWVPGRLIGTPILRVNRGVHRAQVAGEPYAVLLLDFMKAFPSVLLESMWQVLGVQGWDPAYIRAFRIMHTDMRQYSKIGGRSFPGPPKKAGLWTGSGASTVLLLCMLDVLVRVVYSSPYFDHNSGVLGTIDGFADDLNVLVHTSMQLRAFRWLLFAFQSWSGVGPSLTKSVLILPEYLLQDKAEWVRALWPSIKVVLVDETLGMAVGACRDFAHYFTNPTKKFKLDLAQWLLQALSKGESVLVWNIFLLSKFSYVAQFFPPPRALLGVLRDSLKSLMHVSPTFPEMLLYFSHWALDLGQAPLCPDPWFMSIMERAGLQLPYDPTLASSLNGTEMRHSSIDWHHHWLPARWVQVGVNVSLMRRRVRSVHYRAGRFPLYRELIDHSLVCRLYTDGSVLNGELAYAGVFVLGSFILMEFWGRVQMCSSGANYWGPLTASSGVAELSPYIALPHIFLHAGEWLQDGPASHPWPRNRLLCCLDNLQAAGVLAGHLMGSSDPAVSYLAYSSWACFCQDRGVQLAFQHVPSHVGIFWNEYVDRMVHRAWILEAGEFAYTVAPMNANTRRRLASLQSSVDPGWTVVESDPASPAPRPGAQNACYSHWLARQWLRGVPQSIFSKRVKRWWSVDWTILHVRRLFHLHHSTPMRLRWTFYTALLGEWPTGRRTRHILNPGSEVPVCRFCGAHTDCVVHWFGAGACSVLDVMLRSSVALPPTPDGGWLQLDPANAAWPLIWRSFYAVHSLLRWGVVQDPLFKRSLHEGHWLAAACVSDAHSMARVARIQQQKAHRALTAARRRKRKLSLKHTLETCPNCGGIFPIGTHNVCIVRALFGSQP